MTIVIYQKIAVTTKFMVILYVLIELPISFLLPLSGVCMNVKITFDRRYVVHIYGFSCDLFEGRLMGQRSTNRVGFLLA